MKPFRKLLRLWIALASVASFLFGWAILAHSPKPVAAQSSSVQAPPAQLNLPPIQPYGGSVNNGGLGFFSNNAPATSNTQPIQPSTSFPRLRTRGS